MLLKMNKKGISNLQMCHIVLFYKNPCKKFYYFFVWCLSVRKMYFSFFSCQYAFIFLSIYLRSTKWFLRQNLKFHWILKTFVEITWENNYQKWRIMIIVFVENLILGRNLLSYEIFDIRFQMQTVLKFRFRLI